MADVAIARGSVRGHRCTGARLRRLESFFGVRCPPAEPEGPAAWQALSLYEAALAGIRYGFPLCTDPGAGSPRDATVEQTRYSDAATRTHAELAHGAAVRAGWIVPLTEHEVPPSRISFTSYIAKKAAGQYRAIVDASARVNDSWTIGSTRLACSTTSPWS